MKPKQLLEYLSNIVYENLVIGADLKNISEQFDNQLIKNKIIKKYKYGYFYPITFEYNSQVANWSIPMPYIIKSNDVISYTIKIKDRNKNKNKNKNKIKNKNLIYVISNYKYFPNIKILGEFFTHHMNKLYNDIIKLLIPGSYLKDIGLKISNIMYDRKLFTILGCSSIYLISESKNIKQIKFISQINKIDDEL
jgi:hypothetical protein